MSAFGRRGTSVNLNTVTISALDDFNKRLEILDVFDRRILQAESDIDISETDISGLKTNLGLPSIIELTDDGGNIVQEGRDASGLNLKVESNITNIEILQNQVGNDLTIPKTGIYSNLHFLQNGSNLKPFYYKVQDYYVLLEKAFPSSTPIIYVEKFYPDAYNPGSYYSSYERVINPKTVYVDSENQTINEILLKTLEDTDINKKNINFLRKCITSVGFGNNSTCILAPPLHSINFNTRTLGSVGIDLQLLGFTPVTDTLENLAVSFNQLLEKIATFFLVPVSTLVSFIPGGIGQIEIADILDGLLEPNHPIQYLEQMLLTKVMINANGNLMVKDYSYKNASSTEKNILTNEFSAPFLNVHQYVTKAKDLVSIFNLDDTSLELIENSSIDTKKEKLAVLLKAMGGLDKEINEGLHIQLKYDGLINKSGLLTYTPSSGTTASKNGLYINFNTEHMEIDATNHKLQLNLHPTNSCIYSAPTGIFIRTDNVSITKVDNSTNQKTLAVFQEDF